VLFQGKFDLTAGGLYTIFVVGADKLVDTMFLQDFIPVITDSSAGVRFVNLAQGSSLISVNLEGNDPAQTEFSNLGYKQVSNFKSYTGMNGITYYNFEVRDQASGNILTTFSWNIVLFKNQTLVING